MKLSKLLIRFLMRGLLVFYLVIPIAYTYKWGCIPTNGDVFVSKKGCFLVEMSILDAIDVNISMHDGINSER